MKKKLFSFLFLFINSGLFSNVFRDKLFEKLRDVFIDVLGECVFLLDYKSNKLFAGVDDIYLGVHKPCREQDVPFDDFVKTGDVVLDVGGHIGTSMIRLAGLVGSTGHVFVVEPDSRNVGLCCLNSWVNGFSDFVSVFPMALSTVVGRSKLFMHGDNAFGLFGSLCRDDVVAGFTWVDTINFDVLFGLMNVDRVDFAKFDIEGFEEILFCSEVDVWENQRIGCFYVDRHSSVDYEHIERYLSGFGYSMSVVNNGNGFMFKKIDENIN